MESLSPHSFLGQLHAAWPPEEWTDCHVIAALSGGADSVALLRGLQALVDRQPGEVRGHLIAAHYNHRLRGADSDADQAWVIGLCRDLGIDCLTESAHASATLTSEQLARQARYLFLQRVAERTGARFVATAHTADDQVETVLMRIFRGTGIAGLAGIPRYRPLGQVATLVRPLLAFRRAEIEAYLEGLGQAYRIDTSNRELNFTRNWIRQELLPLARRGLPYAVDAAILRLAGQADEWQSAIVEVVEQLAGPALVVEGSPPVLRLHASRLAGLPPILVREACRQRWRSLGWPEQQMAYSDWQRLASAVASKGPIPMLPGGISVARQGEWLVLEAPHASSGPATDSP